MVLAELRSRLQACSDVLVDSNVLLDISTDDLRWKEWSASALAECIELAPLVVKPIIYAEVSVSCATIEALDVAFPRSIYRREPLPWEAGFLAGKCFMMYGRRGGPRTTPLPDFYIGSLAAVGVLALLTRDISRYRTYFPKLEILCPDDGR